MISLFPNQYPRYNQLFTRQTIQNSVLKSRNAMPLKDMTSTDDSDFSIDRYKYNRINQFIPQNQIPVTHADVDGNSYKNTVLSDKKDYKKKWYGNRDASQIVANRRVNSVGSGSMNAANKPLSFVSDNDRNTQRDARKRVRSGGAVVPAKVTHNYKNAPIFY